MQTISKFTYNTIFHQLLNTGEITTDEFKAGQAFIKLYQLSMRSRGIKNHVRTYCQNWENLSGIVHDNFSSHQIEALWNKILITLDQHPPCPFAKQILIDIAISSNTYKSTTLHQIKIILKFLLLFWEMCKNTPYKNQVKQLRKNITIIQKVPCAHPATLHPAPHHL